MWKVGTPHEPVNVNLVAQLDADPVELETPVTIFADVFARRTTHGFQSKQSIGPAMVAIVTNVSALQKERNPADLIFREKTEGLREDEKSELDHYLQIEHLMRLAKARAHHYLANG